MTNAKAIKFKIVYMFCLFGLVIFFPGLSSAQISKIPAVTQYVPCNVDNKPPACAIAFAKLRTLKNPLKPHNIFENGLNIVEGQIFAYPDFYIAETDIDGDGYNEIIVKILEEDELMVGQYCKAVEQCLHYIFQDRNLGTRKSSLKNIRAFGPFFIYSIGLSTDEIFGGFRSLRFYKDSSWQNFDVYQYDKKTDDYYNISALE